MKKFLPFLLAGVMALSCSSFVIAEEETEFNIDEIMSQLQDVEVTEEHYEGSAITLDDRDELANSEEIVSHGSFVEEESLGIKYFLPDFMEELELDEADKEKGILRFYWNGDNATFHIMVTESTDIWNDIEYLKALEAAGDYDPMLLDVNGIEGVIYFTKPDDEESPSVMSVAYIPEDTDTIVAFNFTPGEVDSEFVDYYRVMIASIQKIEAE